MAKLINLPTITDARGSLTVIEHLLPFRILRVFFIYGVKSARGGHRHKKTQQALICVSGVCTVTTSVDWILDTPSKCLILEAEDYHTMNFSEGAVLCVLASTFYDKGDYIYDRP